MRRLLFMAAMLPLLASAATDVYRLRMTLRVPRVHDNAESAGWRKYQPQRLEGELRVERAEGREPSVSLTLANWTHRVGGFPVAYRCSVGGVLWHVVGSNRTGVFRTASVKFDLDADPSYNIGADEPDNTLLLTLAGWGRPARLRGMAAGQIGCGCMAYGHVSPTRLLYDLCFPVDTAAVWGTWSAVKLRTEE